MKGLKKIMASFQTRTFRAGSYSVAITAVVIAIAVAVNLLAAALPADWLQIDVSANQLFTLSQQTEMIAGGLEEDVTIYWIVRSGNEDTYLKKLLQKYTALSDRLTVVQKDPDLYPTFSQAYTEKVNENSLVVESDQRFRYVDFTDIYMLDYESYYYQGTQVVNFYGEQALTSALDFVTSENLPKLYTLTGHGEQALSSALTTAIDQENIEVAELSLLTLPLVPEDADMVLINAPTGDISEAEASKLNVYLAEGGKLLVLTTLQKTGPLTNLEGLMAQWGLTANEGLVMEGDQSYYLWDAPYYLLPEIKSTVLTDPLITNNYRVLLSTAQGLTISETLPDQVSAYPLLVTSDTAYSKVAGYAIETYEKEEGDIDGPFSLAAMVRNAETEGTLIWVGAASLLDSQNNSMVSGANQDLFLNMVGYLCEPEESNISIRAKSLDSARLTLDSSTANLLAILVIGVLPLGFLVYGFTVWYRRKRR